MTGLRRAPAAVFLLLSVASGCGSGDGEAPSAPVAPAPPPAPPSPPPELRLVDFSFGGPLFQPNAALPIARGARLSIPVMTSAPRLGQASVLVRTDAPQAVLSVSSSVRVGGSGEPGLVEVRAPEDAPNRKSPAAYRIWLEEDPAVVWAAGFGAGVDDTPLLIAVVEAPAPLPPCETLELRARVEAGVRDGGIRAPLTFGPLADDFRAGEITLLADHPETSLSLVSQYRMPYEDLDPESDRARVRYRPYPAAIAFGLGFRETAGGFEQTMTLGWFEEIHLRAEAPGCDPVQLSCDNDGRCAVAGPSR